jgi:EpsG family
LQDKADSSIAGYINTGYSSSGTAIRVAMNALPACLYFLYRSRFRLDQDERRFADVLALIALAFVGLLLVSPSSTAVDRMALYIIPIQLFVLGRLPLALARTEADYKRLAAGVVAYSAAVIFVWLNFAVDAPAWVRYSLIDADKLVGLSF